MKIPKVLSKFKFCTCSEKEKGLVVVLDFL